MPVEREQIVDEFSREIARIVHDLGETLRENVHVLTDYASIRAIYLSTLIHEDGFEEAVIVEQQNVLMRAAEIAVEAADRTDDATRASVVTALRFAAGLLATV